MVARAPGEDEQEALRHEVIRRMMVVRRVVKQAVKQARSEHATPEIAKVGEGQYHAIHCLYEDGQLTAGELAERCHVADPTISKMLKSLEGSGLVERRTDPSNRRVVWVRLTEQGRAMHDRMVAHFHAGLAGVLHPLSAQQLRDILIAFAHLESLVDTAEQERGSKAGF
jgi:DNA-binding MarR family transcriptional regulator